MLRYMLLVVWMLVEGVLGIGNWGDCWVVFFYLRRSNGCGPFATHLSTALSSQYLYAADDQAAIRYGVPVVTRRFKSFADFPNLALKINPTLQS